ncbi:cyclic nucleotide-binding protein [Magnetococcus marinus MC-1]|uniref:Cyclic nucleotide-binding protein n=1 Tax=Magnetococcus marinus (strain ATCC BAA-1437 / JCM 17883 / MC-1) TaxID=156889 RepID=A0L677_MAGMM|nr:cyclic nucleotide-binding domain-containing protein [Magnetococcus marinus]ABK43470.1 cyclic nucleotide-binding protein [Magnetococcus marinus MC-1]
MATLSLKLLEQIPFFWGFTAEQLTMLLNKEDDLFATFSPDQSLCREGENDGTLFVVLRGSAKVVSDAAPNTILAELEDGAVLGEMALLAQRPRNAHVIATSELTAFRINEATIRSLDTALQLKIVHELAHVLIKRHDETRDALIKQKQINATLVHALREAKLGD